MFARRRAVGPSRGSVRPPAFAGGAYHADPEKLRRWLDEVCLARAPEGGRRRGDIVGLVAPHIDPWRGVEGYARAYGALRDHPSAHVDTYVLLGTSHAPMRRPFALTRRTFATPLGALEVDDERVDELARASRFDPFADEALHDREHSLELQAVFLRHLSGSRPIRIVPILCGLGACPWIGRDPATDPGVESFLVALADVCAGRSVCVVAGADLAHVGPRFGDRAACDEAAREDLAEVDRASLALAAGPSARELFFQLQRDIGTRRVCGLGPMYTLARALRPGARGEVLHYEQTIDPKDGSIVSYGAVGYWA
jgi:AmmeMemoRadiSam system protein B